MYPLWIGKHFIWLLEALIYKITEITLFTQEDIQGIKFVQSHKQRKCQEEHLKTDLPCCLPSAQAKYF